MLNHTKKIKEIYEVIQKMIFYMIPEKWDKLYLYSSVIDMPEGKKTGELYFYYIPKGILRKKPVNVYEIPSKFNIDEEEYLKLVKALYQKIQQAEVIAVGPGGVVDGKEVVMQVKPGDKVIYSKYSGTEVKLDEDENLIIVKQSDILAIIE